MRKPTKKLISTAYHEAGHAAAAIFQDIKIDRASIEEGDDYLGMVTTEGLGRVARALDRAAYDDDAITPNRRVYIEKRIIELLAGGIAERKHKGRNNYRGSSEDRRFAVDLMLRLTGGDTEEAGKYFDWLYYRAERLIHGRWPFVEAIAQALLDKTNLTSDEILQVVRGVH